MSDDAPAARNAGPNQGPTAPARPAPAERAPAAPTPAAPASAAATGASAGAARDAGPRPAAVDAAAARAQAEGPIYDTVALIGLGLIGSSIAWAARRAGLARRIVGHARSAATRETAARLGFCDEVFAAPAECVRDADLVILCVPVGAMEATARAIAPALKPGAVVSDVGSVKAAVIEAVAPHLPQEVHFIPAHPLAGTEHSGPEAGFAELFDNRWCILTPLPGSDRGQVARLRRLWEGCGANVDEMDPAHHDLVLAVTSHAPHLIAYTMVGVADHLRRVTDSEVIKYSAAGFRDFTRIAASDPTMWRDVFLNNKEATLEILGRFTEELFVLQRAIRMGDGDLLFDYFTRTRAIRRGIIEAGQDTAAPDFGRVKPSRPAPARSAEAPAAAGADPQASARDQDQGAGPDKDADLGAGLGAGPGADAAPAPAPTAAPAPAPAADDETPAPGAARRE
ncbi:prephenate dehydrogenase [Oceanicella actignis]|nr:prephenate dehydrogenase [Oceanicella actignis]